MHYVDLYYLAGVDEINYVHKQSGVMRPVSTRELAYYRMTFYIPLDYMQEAIIYMRFQNGASMTLPLTIWSSDSFINQRLQETILLGLFYGALLIMLLYNLFLFITIRDRSYVYFILFLISIILACTTYDGLLELYFFSFLTIYKKFTVSWLVYSSLISLLLFTDSFLALSQNQPRLHKLTHFLIAIQVFQIILVFFLPYALVGTLFSTVVPITLMAVFITTLVLSIRDYQKSRYFVFSWFGFILGSVLLLLTRLGVLKSSFFSEESSRIGLVWLVGFWAIALAERINLLRTETQTINQELSISEARYRQLVETMNDGLGVVDENGRYSYVNNRLAEMLGYQQEEIIGKPAANFFGEDNLPIFFDQLALRQRGINHPYEITFQRKDGSNLYTHISPSILSGIDEPYTGSFAVITDITHHVRYNQLLEQQVVDRTNELSILLDLSQEISTEGLDYLLFCILEQLEELVKYGGAAIFQLKDDHWSIEAHRGFSLAGEKEFILSKINKSVVIKELKGRQEPILMNLATQDNEFADLRVLVTNLSHLTKGEPHLWLSISLRASNRLNGLFIISSPNPQGFTNEQIKIITGFTNQAALIIESHRHIDQATANGIVGERNRLARDLHDSVTQVLFAASLLAEVIPQIWSKDPQKGLKSLDELRRLTRAALAEMRTMLLELRPSAIIKTPLNNLLAQLTEALTGRTELLFELFLEQIPPLPEDVHICFYRIAQESLNNVIKHADARLVEISLSFNCLSNDEYETDRYEVKLIVRDDGIGFIDKNEGAQHLGLGIMRERADAIQANLSIESEAGKGTTVILTWLTGERDFR